MESIDRYLRTLESDQLIRLAEDLADLQAHPGWARLQDLVALESSRVKDSTQALIWGRLARGKGLEDEASLTHAAGVVRGIGRPAEIIVKVQGLAAEVREQLDREGV